MTTARTVHDVVDGTIVLNPEALAYATAAMVGDGWTGDVESMVRSCVARYVNAFPYTPD